MASTTDLEKRMQKVERAVEELTCAVLPPADPKSAWYVDQAGRFADDPVFDEIVELGRREREAQRPKPRRGSRGRP